MAAKVEANSLSEISQLATNPPRYPRNPTEQQRKPLTLYISRVPGSKDIILTTLKPRLKNVTAEDVFHSLYYLHFGTEEDAKFLGNEDAIMPNTTRSNSLKHKSVPRKALPDTARLSFSEDTDGHTTDCISKPGIALQTPLEGGESKISTDKPPTGEPSQRPLVTKTSIRRKPLGPRSLLLEPSGLRTSLREEPAGLNDAKSSGCGLPILQKHDTQNLSEPEQNSPVTQQVGATRSATFLINLIRRDPAVGTQMNVGTISGDLEACGETTATRRSKSKSSKIYPTISIHVTTPGYNQFQLPQPNRHIAASDPDLENLSKENSPQYLDHHLGFHREVRMEGSGFWSRQTKFHKKALSYDSGRDNKLSTQDFGSTTTAAISRVISPRSVDSSEGETRGYVFASPWGGRCKFSTGGGGRSLRCRHKLPAPLASSNTTDSGTLPQALLISELRFNLPSSSLFTSSRISNSPPKPKAEIGHIGAKAFGHIRDKISPQKPNIILPPLPPRSQSTSNSAVHRSDDEYAPPLPPRSPRTAHVTESSSDDGVWDHSQDGLNSIHHQPGSHLDLRLGQEKAGGGNRGKRAKLGKLIIHDEGFKMLDLIVAANMGIWWTVWESQYR